jgi:hypothetical protein
LAIYRNKNSSKKVKIRPTKLQKSRLKNDNNKTPTSPITTHADSELTRIEKTAVFATLLREEQRQRARMAFSRHKRR